MVARPARSKTQTASGQTASMWQADLAAGYALHLSGFAVRFSPCAGDGCPACCMIVRHGGQAWLGCPDGVPLDLAPDEIREWVRQGAYAFLAALHAAGDGHAL